MVGLMGRVTGTVGPGLVGEVIVRVRDGAEHFLACPATGTERIERGTVEMEAAMGFRIVTGRGPLVLPGVQRVCRRRASCRSSDPSRVTHGGSP